MRIQYVNASVWTVVATQLDGFIASRIDAEPTYHEFFEWEEASYGERSLIVKDAMFVKTDARVTDVVNRRTRHSRLHFGQIEFP